MTAVLLVGRKVGFQDWTPGTRRGCSRACRDPLVLYGMGSVLFTSGCMVPGEFPFVSTSGAEEVTEVRCRGRRRRLP